MDFLGIYWESGIRPNELCVGRSTKNSSSDMPFLGVGVNGQFYGIAIYDSGHIEEN